MRCKQITKEDRFYIKKRLNAGDSKYKIAKDLGFPHTTIAREIKVNTDPTFKGIYNHLVVNHWHSNGG